MPMLQSLDGADSAFVNTSSVLTTRNSSWDHAEIAIEGKSGVKIQNCP